ncbi:unnamed protein product [Vicia faba]|uniref:Uncharacterized protein n=1 Tax=Vicia faba TaxID=3906 RepID=A0AAV0YBW3_VICFA|nr:unnamed protein product [Vicia faba]
MSQTQPSLQPAAITVYESHLIAPSTLLQTPTMPSQWLHLTLPEPRLLLWLKKKAEGRELDGDSSEVIEEWCEDEVEDEKNESILDIFFGEFPLSDFPLTFLVKKS